MRPFTFLSAVVVGVLSADPTLAGYDLTPRPLLTTADVVAPLGPIGMLSVDARGVDARGRLLVSADLSDGTSALLWADGAGMEILWRGDADDLPHLVPGAAATSPNGRVVITVGRTRPRDELPSAPDILYQVSPPPLRALATVGDRTTSGDTFGPAFAVAAVADDGSVALNGTILPADDPRFHRGAALLLREDGIHVVAADYAGVPAQRYFQSLIVEGLNPAGEVVLWGIRWDVGPASRPPWGIYAAGVDAIRPIVVDGDHAPSGLPLRGVRALGVAPNGEVLLAACEGSRTTSDDVCDDLARLAACHTYRTDNGQLVRVSAGDDRTPDGYRFWAISGSLADSGDAVLQADWLDDRLCQPFDDPVFSGLLRYPVSGSPQLIATHARGGNSNAAGDVVVVPIGYEQSLGIDRWRAGTTNPIIAPDSVTPDGAMFIGGGLFGPHCLADDGRAATFARFPDASEALVCVDDRGTHVIATTAPTGVRQCAFAEGEMIYAAGNTIYRVVGGAIDSVAGPRTVTDRGVSIYGFFQSSAPFRSEMFAVNAAGTIVARAHTIEGTIIVRQRRGGPLEQIPLALPDGTLLGSITQAEVADNETIVALGRPITDPTFPAEEALVVAAFDDGGWRILFTDRELGGEPDSLWVRGSRVAFMVNHGAVHYVYDLRDATLTTILDRTRFPDVASDPFLIDFAANGDAVFFSYLRSEQSTTLNGRWLLSDSGIQLLSSDTSADQPTTDPVALNPAGNILFEAINSAPQVLSMSGPPASGHCPSGSASPDADDGSDGCQLSGAAKGSWWLLLPLVLVTVARRPWSAPR